jgi:hypothetical protein
MVTDLLLPLNLMAYFAVYTWASGVIRSHHVPACALHAGRTSSRQTKGLKTGGMDLVPARWDSACIAVDANMCSGCWAGDGGW